METVLIIILNIFFSLIAGFGFGVAYERFQWNKLIDKGIIPKPHDR